MTLRSRIPLFSQGTFSSSRQTHACRLRTYASSFLPVTLSICASRLLFNLHELAEELVGHPTFALNTVELGRLNLRKGPRHGEFIVEVGESAETSRDTATNASATPLASVSEREAGRTGVRKSWFGRREERGRQARRSEQWLLPRLSRFSNFHIGQSFLPS